LVLELSKISSDLDVDDNKLSRGGLFEKFIFLFGPVFATSELVKLSLPLDDRPWRSPDITVRTKNSFRGKNSKKEEAAYGASRASPWELRQRPRGVSFPAKAGIGRSHDGAFLLSVSL